MKISTPFAFVAAANVAVQALPLAQLNQGSVVEIDNPAATSTDTTNGWLIPGETFKPSVTATGKSNGLSIRSAQDATIPSDNNDLEARHGWWIRSEDEWYIRSDEVATSAEDTELDARYGLLTRSEDEWYIRSNEAATSADDSELNGRHGLLTRSEDEWYIRSDEVATSANDNELSARHGWWIRSNDENGKLPSVLRLPRE